MVSIAGNNVTVEIQQHTTNGGASIARFMLSDKKVYLDGDVDIIGNIPVPNLYNKTEIDTMLGYASSYTPAVETILNTALDVPELNITNGLIMGNDQPIGAKNAALVFRGCDIFTRYKRQPEYNIRQ